jgi:hypothetical protein
MQSMPRIIVSGQMSGSHLSMVELIDGGLCKIQPQRCQPSGIPDGDLYGVFLSKTWSKTVNSQADLGTRGVGGDSISASAVQFVCGAASALVAPAPPGPMATNNRNTIRPCSNIKPLGIGMHCALVKYHSHRRPQSSTAFL